MKSAPLSAAAECLALAAAMPPMAAAAALRVRTPPGNDAVLPLPSANLAGCSQWFPVLLIINPPFAAGAAFLSPG